MPNLRFLAQSGNLATVLPEKVQVLLPSEPCRSMMPYSSHIHKFWKLKKLAIDMLKIWGQFLVDLCRIIKTRLPCFLLGTTLDPPLDSHTHLILPVGMHNTSLWERFVLTTGSSVLEEIRLSDNGKLGEEAQKPRMEPQVQRVQESRKLRS